MKRANNMRLGVFLLACTTLHSATVATDRQVSEEAVTTPYPFLYALKGHTNGVHSVTFRPDGLRLASGAADDTVKIWDTAEDRKKEGTQPLLHNLEWHFGMVETVAYDPKGTMIASGSRDKSIKIWDTVTDDLVTTLKDHSATVNSVAFSPDGGLLASGSDDGTIKVWDASSWKILYTIVRDHPVYSVAFQPSGTYLASTTYSSTAAASSLEIWHPTPRNDGAVLLRSYSHSDSISQPRSVAWRADGTRLATGDDHKIHLYDATDLAEHGRGPIPFSTDAGGLVKSVAWNGRTLAAGLDDGTVRIWNTETMLLERTLVGHTGKVTAVAFGADGRRLASGSWDNTIRVWDSSSGNLAAYDDGYYGDANDTPPTKQYLSSADDADDALSYPYFSSAVALVVVVGLAAFVLTRFPTRVGGPMSGGDLWNYGASFWSHGDGSAAARSAVDRAIELRPMEASVLEAPFLDKA